MARKAASDGGRATIEKLYPKDTATELTKKRLTEKLKTYTSKTKRETERKNFIPYRDRAFPVEGLLRVEEARSDEEKDVISFPSKSMCYLHNLLELDSLTGGIEETIDILWKQDPKSRQKQREFLVRRFGELSYIGQKYMGYAKNADRLINSLLGRTNPIKDDLFALNEEVSKTIEKIKPSEEMSPPDDEQRVSFIGLTSLERIDRIGRSERLTAAEKNAEKAVVYLELGNTDLALQFANKALSEAPTNGYAWMVKGYLSLKGVKEAIRSCAVQKELGAHSNPVSAEEQWHQELLEDDIEKADRCRKESVDFFLKAWNYWPANASVFLSAHGDYKQGLMASFFKAVGHADFDKELFKKAIKKDIWKLQLLCLRDMNLFLTTILPVVHSADTKMATILAKDFVQKIKESKPAKDDLNPPDPTTNDILLSAGKYLGDLQVLSLALPFAEVEAFMHEVAFRFAELEETTRIKNMSGFYLDRIKGMSGRDSVQYCNSVLKNIPFKMNRPFDERLQKQWQYLLFSSATQAAIESMLYKESGDSKSVALLLAKSLTSELLEQVAGKEHLIQIEEYDDDSDSVSCQDLRGRKFHVLHDNVSEMLDGIIRPFKADDWFEKLISECTCVHGEMSHYEWLLLYLDGLASGTLKPGYQAFLRSLEKKAGNSDKALKAFRKLENRSIKTHTAFSFVLSYALQAKGLKKDVVQQLKELKAASDKVKKDDNPKRIKIIEISLF
jgi:tetratricopeptide (TPR) repeat protein